MVASSAPIPPNQGGDLPGPTLKSQIIAPGRAAEPPTVREAHLKNEDMTRKKLAFSLAYASFFFVQELAVYLFQAGAYCLFYSFVERRVEYRGSSPAAGFQGPRRPLIFYTFVSSAAWTKP